MNTIERFSIRSMFTVLGVVVSVVVVTAAAAGCAAGGKGPGGDKGFFTSGNREADQRADQRMAKTEQLRGGGEGAGEKASAKVTADGKPAMKADQQKSLYDRVGGEAQLKAIVDDFVTRAIADPRVNWTRRGVTVGGFSSDRNKSMTWTPTDPGIAQLKKHIVQLLSLSTGGPAFYDGLDMKAAHAHLHISNAEFDAAVGDFKASLDKLQVPNKEQKELLSIIESTRPQVVEER